MFSVYHHRLSVTLWLYRFWFLLSRTIQMFLTFFRSEDRKQLKLCDLESDKHKYRLTKQYKNKNNIKNQFVLVIKCSPGISRMHRRQTNRKRTGKKIISHIFNATNEHGYLDKASSLGPPGYFSTFPPPPRHFLSLCPTSPLTIHFRKSVTTKDENNFGTKKRK